MHWLSILFAISCAALMGFAIQRGGTCLVAVVEEAIGGARPVRLLALAETAIWVGGSLALIGFLGLEVPRGRGFEPGWMAIAGGMLLGLGAWINRGCLFGTVARLGGGEWSYAAVPVGFLAGSAVASSFGTPVAHNTATPPAWLPATLAVVTLLLTLAHGAGAIGAFRQRRFASYLWAPHRATLTIGLAFLALLLAAGPWTYSDALAQLASGQTQGNAMRLALFAALFGGALAGAWTAGRLAHQAPRPGPLARSLAGGFLMGLGGWLVPGGNDTLILIALPMLQGYALAALAAMAATIACASLIARRLAKPDG